MSSVLIATGTEWIENVKYLNSLKEFRPSETTVNFYDLQDIVDVIVDGSNITSSISRASIFPLFAQFLESIQSQLSGHQQKSIVEFHSEPWEITLVGRVDRMLITVASLDKRQRVIVHDADVDANEFIESVVKAAQTMLSALLEVDHHFSSDPFIRRFSSNLGAIVRSVPYRFPVETTEDHSIGHVRLGTTGASGFVADVVFDGDYHGLRTYVGEHMFDQHALLIPGELAIETTDERIVISEYPIIATKALVSRAHELLSLMTSSNREFAIDEKMCGFSFHVRQVRDAFWDVSFSTSTESGIGLSLDSSECLETIISLGELVVDKLSAINPLIQANQRYEDFRAEVNELRAWWSDLTDTNVYCDDPNDYLSTHGALSAEPSEVEKPTFAFPFERVRALYPRHRWSFSAEKIHFTTVAAPSQTIFVPCDGRLSVLSASDGEVRWAVDGNVASFQQTKEWVAVAFDDGHVEVRRVSDGVQLSSVENAGSWLNHGIRYDDIFIVSDHKGCVCAIDVVNDAVLWRADLGRGTTVDVAAQGPLYMVLHDNGTLIALNPANGDVLWRVRLGGIGELGPWIYDDTAFAISYDLLTHLVSLHAIQPLTGRTLWQLRFEGRLAGSPSFVDGFAIVPIERAGRLWLTGVPLESGTPEVAWRIELPSAGLDSPTPVLSVGAGRGIVRTDCSDVLCFDVNMGRVLWHHGLDETALLYRNLPLIQVQDAFLSVGETVTLRSIETGEVWHEFGHEIESPEMLIVLGKMNMIYGERGAAGAPDQLVAFALENFLAVV